MAKLALSLIRGSRSSDSDFGGLFPSSTEGRSGVSLLVGGGVFEGGFSEVVVSAGSLDQSSTSPATRRKCKC